jgi:hypothetical protein
MQPRNHHSQRENRSVRYAGNLLGKIRQAGGVELEAKVGNDNGEEQLKKIPGVRDVVTDGEDDWKKFSLRVESGADVREEVFRLAVERHWAVRELTQRRGNARGRFRRAYPSGSDLTERQWSNGVFEYWSYELRKLSFGTKIAAI